MNKKINLNDDLILDGAMGTLVMERENPKAGFPPELFNIEKPELILNIHKDYVKAGADCVNTNTFGANPYKLKNYKEVINKGIELALNSGAKYVAFDIGPSGKLFGQDGFDFEECYNCFKDIILAGQDKTDFIYFETFTDLRELRTAIIAAKENSSLPVVASMSFSENGRTPFGTDADSFVYTALSAGADAVGANCSVGADKMLTIAKRLTELTDKPVFIKANAGMPFIKDGKTVYDTDSETFSKQNAKIKKAGVNAIGGCCGTNPEYIEKIKDEIKDIVPEKRKCKKISAVCSSSKTVYIDGDMKIIGERINPTGKKKFKEALISKDYDYAASCGIVQERDGAHILDVNVGLNGIDEKAAMGEVMERLFRVSELPLQIDSSDEKVIEFALRNYCGKAIVNSVNASDESLNKILPLVKKYNSAVVGLTLDEKGIPDSAEGREALAEKIINKCLDFGIDKNDIIIDVLTLSEASAKGSAKITIEALKKVKKLQVKTVLGISNISFGMPARENINAAFLDMAKKAGLDFAIINPTLLKIIPTKEAFDFLNAKDGAVQNYIERFSDVKNIAAEEIKTDLKTAIITGQKDLAEKEAGLLSKELSSVQIVEKFIIPALDEVGANYEKGRFFLPQLIASAEAAKSAFSAVEEKSGTSSDKNKRFVLATVKGDIHDIGKNIVKSVTANYGFTVIDLGRDVDYDVVLKAVEDNYPCVLGLSALMTTTVNNMEKTIKLVKAKFDIPILVGGAVLTKEYAEKIGGIYCSDANDTVKKLKDIFK